MAAAAETESFVPCVLVVDDDADVRDALSDLLSGEGFGVELAVDGLDALSVLDHRGGRFDAVVCDLDMPRLDGTGLVRTLRRRGLDAVVLILSARFDLLATTTGLGQVYAMAKPVDVDQLLATLREAIRQRS
jgi:two-component system response regulator MprA